MAPNTRTSGSCAGNHHDGWVLGPPIRCRASGVLNEAQASARGETGLETEAHPGVRELGRRGTGLLVPPMVPRPTRMSTEKAVLYFNTTTTRAVLFAEGSHSCKRCSTRVTKGDHRPADQGEHRRPKRRVLARDASHATPPRGLELASIAATDRTCAEALGSGSINLLHRSLGIASLNRASRRG